MLRLRLQRRGKRNYATYRIVVADGHAPIKGRFIADVGHYNPHTDEFSVNKEQVTNWLGKGVQPSATVHNLLVSHDIIEAPKVKSWSPKKKRDTGSAGDVTGTEDSKNTEKTTPQPLTTTPSQETQETSGQEPTPAPSEKAPKEINKGTAA